MSVMIAATPHRVGRIGGAHRTGTVSVARTYSINSNATPGLVE